MTNETGTVGASGDLPPSDPAGSLPHTWPIHHQAALLAERLPDLRDRLIATQHSIDRIAHATVFHWGRRTRFAGVAGVLAELVRFNDRHKRLTNFLSRYQSTLETAGDAPLTRGHVRIAAEAFARQAWGGPLVAWGGLEPFAPSFEEVKASIESLEAICRQDPTKLDLLPHKECSDPKSSAATFTYGDVLNNEGSADKGPISGFRLAQLIEAALTTHELIAPADLRAHSQGRYGILAGVGSIEAGYLGDGPFREAFGDLDAALRAWAVQREIVLAQFLDNILLTSERNIDGRVENSDRATATVLILVEPQDPAAPVEVVHGFDVWWDFSCRRTQALKGRNRARMGQTWEELFG